MTIQEHKTKMQELRAQLEENVKAYNDAYQNGKFTDAADLDKKADEIVNEYTNHARTICFTECMDAADPMIEAVTRLTYDTITVKDKPQDEESKLNVRIIEDKTKSIDLEKLHKFAKDKGAEGIGYDKNWLYIAQKMNFLMTVAVADDIQDSKVKNIKEISDSYMMAEIAKAIDMGKNPTSNTNLLKTLQQVVTAMIGPDYKAVSHDVKYLLRVYSKRSSKKALTVTCANHKYFRIYMMDICHRLVTGGYYGVEYKARTATK